MTIPIQNDTEAELLVMLRATLFAECTECDFTFSTDSTPVLQINQVYAGGCQTIELVGTNFDMDTGVWTAKVGGSS